MAAIAIPSYSKARGAAQESSAIGTIKAVNNAENLYSNSYSAMYAGALSNLGGTPGAAGTCASAQLMDNNTLSDMAATGGTSKNYTWTYTATGAAITGTGVCLNTNGASSYVITGQPIAPAGNGRSLCSDENLTIHFDIANSKPITETACESLPSL